MSGRLVNTEIPGVGRHVILGQRVWGGGRPGRGRGSLGHLLQDLHLSFVVIILWSVATCKCSETLFLMLASLFLLPSFSLLGDEERDIKDWVEAVTAFGFGDEKRLRDMSHSVTYS